jgi:hypothetical protein
MTQSLVTLANARVPMPVACRAAGVDIPDTYRDGGTKCYCPFGEFSHSDGGKDKAFRVWSDHAWCFSCRTWYSPVKIYSLMKEVSYEQAAIALLDLIGFKPVEYAEHWERASAEPLPDSGALAQALRNFCYTIVPGERLMESPAAEYLSRCLGYITCVKNEDDAEKWLALAKTVMGRVLTGGPHVGQG